MESEGDRDDAGEVGGVPNEESSATHMTISLIAVSAVSGLRASPDRRPTKSSA